MQSKLKEANLNVIILDKKPIRDYDEIITCLTDEGIKKIFAPGVRKATSKNRNALSLMSYVSLEVITSKKLLLRLKRAELIDIFDPRWNMIYFQQTFTHFAYKLIDTNCKNIIDQYSILIKEMNQNKDTKILIYLLLEMLVSLGLNPRLDSCVECKNNKVIDFNFHKGGFLCKEHTEHNFPKEDLLAIYTLSKSFAEFEEKCSFKFANFFLKLIIQYMSEVI
ncbi:DNA replication and repair protein RecO [Metamycoplasma subdolum]|uniref:DNA repair protein RecO n=1 Tax=Metamycoplasma subdolum TaxID=92407 RepID=A0A3M0A343_9BACT|nr:DNA repair protein RecO [Metamycoplasma subdolum]RMA79066.1 DNA replication and repair protein RecO [Metamycoplasma subdolum]WPB50589.1 DNA repair protein RecO [Metamycoplasma subdolum]